LGKSWKGIAKIPGSRDSVLPRGWYSIYTSAFAHPAAPLIKPSRLSSRVVPISPLHNKARPECSPRLTDTAGIERKIARGLSCFLSLSLARTSDRAVCPLFSVSSFFFLPRSPARGFLRYGKPLGQIFVITSYRSEDPLLAFPPSGYVRQNNTRMIVATLSFLPEKGVRVVEKRA